jgi:RNA polymerase-binding protein DksA
VAKKTTKKSGSTPGKLPAKKAVKAKAAAAPKNRPSKTKSSPVLKAQVRKAGVVARVPAVAAATAGPAATSVKSGQVVEPKLAIVIKPGKNQAGLNKSELEHYRDLLLAKRRELLGDMTSMEDEALRNSSGTNLSNLPIHMADMGTDNYEQEFTLGLVEKDRNLLREINAALIKIQTGSFGICEGTGKPITKPRLEAQPWTRFSIEHARRMEQRRLRR